jgi:RNA ligase
MTEFVGFPKIPRLNRDCVITEKLDGTNAQVYITEDGDVFAGSRNRMLTIHDDNFGFANWVEGNKQELLKLGPGRHFGEWWGAGIQRRYDLKEKRFSLFNVARWDGAEDLPASCHVVPVLYIGGFRTTVIGSVVDGLRLNGSQAAPGFMKPEGVIIWHEAARQMFKVTCEDDEKPKGEQ